MKIEQLDEIIKTANKHDISNRLKELGYVFCNNDRKLGKLSIIELIRAIKYETEDFDDKQHKHLYNGRICETVKGYENYEFVIVNVYDIKMSTNPFDCTETAIQTEMLIWAKKSLFFE